MSEKSIDPSCLVPRALDIQYMQHALRLARRGVGQTWPNPAVGAVIVKDDVIVGRGWTARGGRPHAETIALAQAGIAAKDATLYVTLEPCCHTGKTPPCTQAIINAGIKRVVFACIDPNPKVTGGGAKQLQKAGIEVMQGVCEKEAVQLNEGFFSVIKRGRPFVTLKLATSLDGKIADADGKSKWITCEASRQRGHLLRATHDAIITGIGTVLADDPMLTCRLPGLEEDSPVRVVLDSKLRTPANAKLLPAWIFTSQSEASAKAKKLQKAGATLFTIAEQEGHLALDKLLEKLAQLDITRVLVEAGSALASAFMAEDLVDRIVWFRAPLVIGEGGLAALKGKNGALSERKRFTLQQTERLGSDILEIYDCKTA